MASQQENRDRPLNKHNTTISDNKLGQNLTTEDGFDDDDEYMQLEYSDDNNDQVDYYSILGLSSHPPPTESQLRTAYHNLTLRFHPDKQPPHLVEIAERQFSRIQEAYETLIDPKKRIVYDLQGEDGVKREWSPQGLMGSKKKMADDTDAERSGRQQIGPRAMLPDEFRRWFIRKMKERERETINQMVGAKGTITIGFDASSLVSRGENEDEVQLNVPTVRPNQFALKYSFTTPLPDLPGLWPWADGDHEIDNARSVLAHKENEAKTIDSSPEVTFHASVGGALRKTVQRVKIEKDGVEEILEAPGPPVLVSKSFNLHADVSHSFAGLGLRAGPHSKLWSWLDGATVGSTFGIFPKQFWTIHLSKVVAPFPQAKPVHITVWGNAPSHPRLCMPNVGVTAYRAFDRRKLGLIAFSSGTNPWPEFVKTLLSSFINMSVDPSNDLLLVPREPSSLELKYIVTPNAVTAQEAELLDMPSPPTTKEAWSCSMAASPMGGSLSLNYGRTFFADRLSDPPRSEWNLEGYHPIPVQKHFRGIRIEAEATVAFTGDISWSIAAKRQVSTFSSIGLGVGVLNSRGLTMSLSWTRLGQSIKVPIVICPIDLVDKEVSFWAIMIPWLTYVGIEFSYLRPRERRQRREAINRKRKRLESRIPEYKEESARQIELMAESVQRRQERRRVDGGLVIEKAEYGYIPPLNKTKRKRTGDAEQLAQSKIIDVTIPLAALVDKDRLVISKNTIRFQILGFYDPAPLLPKVLRIWYTFGGQQHYVEAKDDEDIFCPRREHVLA